MIYHLERPSFGDLLRLCVVISSSFETSTTINFTDSDSTHLEQVDDYFGVRVLAGGHVAICVYALLSGAVVEHHPGPFDGMRVDYDCSHHTPARAAHFVYLANFLANMLDGASVTWRIGSERFEQFAGDVLVDAVGRACRDSS